MTEAQKPFSVLVTRAIPEAGLKLLQAECRVTMNPEDRPLTRPELLSLAAEADGVIGLLTEKIDAAFFDSAKRVRAYANYAVGIDNISLAEATKRGVGVSNTPGVLTDATAEMAWALLFAVCRRVVESDAAMRSGRWAGWAPLHFIGSGVSGKTLGIVGAGRIGTAMALKGRGFGMKVLYHNRGRNEVLERELSARKVGFDELLAESDFISIHTPLTAETRHLFDAKALSAMKKTAYLINTARGPVIDENALVKALQEGWIAGAGLDVYENEPRMADGLAGLSNAALAAHTGSATAGARSGMATLAAENLLAMLHGRPGPTCLNPEVFAKRTEN
ncbi:MAG: D-glycerate dehydrogenase [Thermodesulfobacteriota bacterium]